MADGAWGTATDPLYEKAVALVRKHRRGSISLVQRHLQIGYNRAHGIVCAMVGTVLTDMPPVGKVIQAEQHDENEVVGHKTFAAEGGGFRHEPLTRGEADALMAHIDAETKRRHELMPDEESARRMLFSAWQRLKELGWREAIYAPREEGAEIEAIEVGSSGVHKCVRMMDGWWIPEHGDLWPSKPCLFRTPKDGVMGMAEGSALVKAAADTEPYDAPTERATVGQSKLGRRAASGVTVAEQPRKENEG